MNSPKLIDKFGRTHSYLRISLTDACNLRCKYCMPNEKIKVTPSSKMMTKEEIFMIAKQFVELGITKIRLTGGEPLVRSDASDIFLLLSKLPVELALSTNAILIDKYIEVLQKSNIKSINISLDSLNAEQFNSISQRKFFDKILANIHLLLVNNFKVKLNVVVLKTINDDCIFDFLEFTIKHPIEVRFIEFMPFKGNNWTKNEVVSYKEMLDIINSKYTYQKIEDYPNDTAKHYKLKDSKGTFAFITTISDPFCSSCNRLRITADGKMKNCLFSNGEADLLTELRNGNDIDSLIVENVMAKKKELGGDSNYSLNENRSMIKIGG